MGAGSVPPTTDAGDVARRAHAAGLCVLPPMQDGTKRPDASRWTRYQRERPPPDQLARWYDDPTRSGVGYVCGAVSRNLEMMEFEDAATYTAFLERARAVGLGPLVERIAGGYEDETPGGGVHWFYRCAEIAGNSALARRPKPTGPGVDVLIETRGEGGYTVAAPSNGAVHPSGRAYRQRRGGVETIADITPQERADLWALARSFDEMPRPAAREPVPSAAAGDQRPGDDYRARGDVAALLEAHGWSHVSSRGAETFWRRPGKTEGISATLNYAGSGLFYAFTSSTAFEQNTSYTPFGVYAVLEHAGDYNAAARDLARQGYGNPARPSSSGRDDPDAPLPLINAADQHLPRVSAAAWAALNAANDPPRLFRFGGLPARLDRDDDHGAPVPRTLTEDRLRHELARAADWYKPNEKGGTAPAAPPVAVVRDMLAAPRFPFPPLAAITEAPAFAPDGSLPAGPGYHAAGRTYYAPAAGLVVPAVPSNPTPAEIAAARELIVADFLGDFPFTGEAERAHAVALLLLPFVRGLVTGPTPLHLIEKPTPGTGASLLADVLTRLVTGRPVGAMAEGRDEDEWRKRITAKLRGAPAVVLLDNLRRRLDSANLSIALTAAEWSDRLLGTSDDLRLPVRCAWVATGNNPALSSEIARRTVRIRLDAQRDRPWLREGFRHPNLGGWTLEHRGELIGACLTLGQAWLAAGRPVPADAPKLGSYEEWSRVLGGILDTAGVPGFLGNLAEFYEQTDTEGGAIRGFLRAWWEQHHGAPVGVGDLFTVATAPESGLDLGDKGERSQRIRLGNRLKELRDRHYQLADDLTVRITDAGTAQRAQLWRLVPTGTETQTAADWSAGESGECGECSESTSKRPHERGEGGERNGHGCETFTTFTTFTDCAEVSV